MSPVEQVGDWWLASDGRWYPPEARPAPPPMPAPPPPPVPGIYHVPAHIATNVYSDVPRPPSTALRGWLQGLCWATAVLLVVLAGSCVATAVAFQRYWTSTGPQRRSATLQDWVDVEEFADGIYGFALVSWLVAIILMMVWMNKAHHVSSRLWPGYRSWSSAWCVGGWFIPVANWVIPKAVMLEIEKVVGSVDEHGELDPHWLDKRGSAIGWVFWLGCVAAILLAIAASGPLPDPAVRFTETDADRYVVAMVVFAVASLIGAIAAACGGFHFRALGRTLKAAAAVRTAAITGGTGLVVA